MGTKMLLNLTKVYSQRVAAVPRYSFKKVTSLKIKQPNIVKYASAQGFKDIFYIDRSKRVKWHEFLKIERNLNWIEFLIQTFLLDNFLIPAQSFRFQAR